LYLKYILKMYFVFAFEIHFDVFYFIFSSKKYKIHLMRKYDVTALISKHILSCRPCFLPVLGPTNLAMCGV